jgi:glucose/arabinose dehydrogenase
MRVLPALALFCAALPALAAEPDGLKLPPGFHAEVVADGLAGARHIAIRANGDIYVSTNTPRGQQPIGIYALRPGADHKATPVRFSTVTGGTGIRIRDGALYAASGTTVWRFDFRGDELVPAAAPRAVVEGMPDENGRNRILAFDGEGNLYVALSGTGNNACAVGGSRSAKPGPLPCPELKDRAGIWRFSAGKMDLKFSDGELFATGNRNMPVLDWLPRQKALYGVFHERDFTHELWPAFASEEDDNNIGEGLYRITRGTDFGWPYSYYDGVRNIRLVAPEYGGDGKRTVPPGRYATPAFNFVNEKGRGAPTDMLFSNAPGWPAAWRDGVLFVRHGGLGADRPGGYAGYDILFLPMDADGKPGKPAIFADGFAGATDDDRTQRRAAYRPVGMAQAPDGALYVVDSTKGRLWRIAYTGR